MFAEVAVPIQARQTYTYRLPPDLAVRAQIGSRVVVRVRRQLLTGFIVALNDDLSGEVAETEIRAVEELIDDTPIISPDIFELTRWMADYYYAPWGEFLRAALPPGASATTEQLLALTEAGKAAADFAPGGLTRSSAKAQALDALSRSGSLSSRELQRRLSKQGVTPTSVNALIRQLERTGLIRISHQVGESRLRPKLQNAVILTNPEPGGRSLTEQQKRVISFLSANGGELALSDLIERTGVAPSVVRTLEKRGAVRVFSREARRDPLAHVVGGRQGAVALTGEQQHALDQIVAKIDAHQYSTFLLHGVTGSGKTEIYVRAMHEALQRGRTAVMLIPEISLTPMLSRRLCAHFGEAVAILHSSLSEGERIDEWRRIKQREARVVIGTRSAVFAPLENLGLIVVDEEHETSYKQDETPRYNGRDTAIVRASRSGAVAILGSATPSLESFHNAHVGKYSYIRLQNRYGGRPLADVRIIDMREVFRRHGKQQSLSDELKAAIAETHGRGEQTMILLNRRGYSSFLLCRSCGLALRCPNCDVTLTYHRFDSSLQCHYCNYIRPVPTACPACDGIYIHYVGEGTEQIEARLRALFPQMNIARLDRDTTRRRGSYEHMIMEFAAGNIDLLVGTQMIAKGHDFPNVTLVGVVSVDLGLSLPDFRSAERTFQLLTQVAGRAGRGDRPGAVLIQSYHPDHYALAAARTQDYDAFYEREIRFRRAMHYPPFTALINLLIRDKDRDRAAATGAALAGELREASRDSPLRVLGPAPAPLARLRGEYRFQVLIKAKNRRSAREALDYAMDRLEAARIAARSITVEVDPINLM